MYVKQIDQKAALELAARGNWQDRRRSSRLSWIPPAGKKRGPKKALDVGKLVALHNAGWPPAKIADELRVTERTVYRYLPSKS